MAEMISKWDVVSKLIALENEFQQYKPFHGFEHAMYRKICELEIAIGKTPGLKVVRCKDCKHCTPSENIIGGYGDCNRFERDNDNSIVCEDDFCAYGERKDNG